MVASASLLEAGIGWQGFVLDGFFEGSIALVEFAAFRRFGGCVGESNTAIGTQSPSDFMLLALGWRRDRTSGGLTDHPVALPFSESAGPVRRLKPDVELMVRDLKSSKETAELRSAKVANDDFSIAGAIKQNKDGQPLDALPNPWSHMDGREAEGRVTDQDSLVPNSFTPGVLPLGIGPHVDLHLPHTSLQELHGGEHGPLSRLLLRLRKVLSTVVGIELRQFGILGIKGKFKQEGSSGAESTQLRDDQDSSALAAPRSHQEVLLTFEIFPPSSAHTAGPKNTSVDKVISSLAEQLADPQSLLLTGPLASVLQGATVNLSLDDLDATSSSRRTRRSLARMSAMALPIGISAAFTGILIWLCAW